MRFILIAVGLTAAAPAFAQVLRYEKASTRALLLRLVNHPPRSELRLKGKPSRDPRVRALVAHYVGAIAPAEARMGHAELRANALHLLIDAGSETDGAEREAWEKQYLAAAEELNDFATDPELTESYRTWARLAEGLSGELADRARRAAEARELQSFPAATKPILAELEELTLEYSKAQKNAAANDTLKHFRGTLASAKRRFKAGEISFAEASAEIRGVYQTEGAHVLGAEAVAATGDLLDRAARLRSRLARAKGFATWAQYRMQENGLGYAPELRGPEAQRAFLRKLKAGLEGPLHAFLDARLSALGLKDADVASQEWELLGLPDLEQLQMYFPGHEITNGWELTMRESGFAADALGQVLVDDEDRPGKNGNVAYMSSMTRPEPRETVLDQNSLGFAAPSTVRPGLATIYQSYKDEGVSDALTAWHEGGHALDWIEQRLFDPTIPLAYGTIEVPSMTSERFAEDADVLLARATPHEGKLPKRVDILRFVANERNNSVFRLARLTSQALYDIDIWDYDYDQPGAETYLARVERLSREHDTFGGRFANVATPTPMHFWWVSTSHFTSGLVRYSGYVFAEIASHMMSEHISLELERQTGRRSWFRQPAFAGIFTKIVRGLWRAPFPRNIERLTGQTYASERLTADLSRRLASSCESNLKD